MGEAAARRAEQPDDGSLRDLTLAAAAWNFVSAPFVRFASIRVEPYAPPSPS
ncbi:hypothetical protein [Streptomyces lydicus]|uniref:hypothetical protein n=1 Tax=Streptomyces lydicus TaxID=47763 RepID=UPI00379B6A41